MMKRVNCYKIKVIGCWGFKKMLKTEDLQFGPRNNLRIILSPNYKKQPAWKVPLLTAHQAPGLVSTHWGSAQGCHWKAAPKIFGNVARCTWFQDLYWLKLNVPSVATAEMDFLIFVWLRFVISCFHIVSLVPDGCSSNESLGYREPLHSIVPSTAGRTNGADGMVTGHFLTHWMNAATAHFTTSKWLCCKTHHSHVNKRSKLKLIAYWPMCALWTYYVACTHPPSNSPLSAHAVNWPGSNGLKWKFKNRSAVIAVLVCQPHNTKQTCLALPITTSNIKVEKKSAERCRIKAQFCRVYWRWSNLAWILTQVAICCNEELCRVDGQPFKFILKWLKCR